MKYRITGKTNGWIADRDSKFNGKCKIVIKDQLTLKDAYKELLDMYNKDNSDNSAPNWGIAVCQKKGASATFSDGTRCYEYDSRYYQIEELPYKMTDLLKEEVQECADVELYCYTGKIHSIHTDNIMSLDKELNFKELYCSGIEELDYEVMDEDNYNNTVLANACDSADFEKLYGNENAKVLVVVLNNYKV